MSGGGKSSIEQPQPIRMPNPNDPAIMAARKLAQANSQRRQGRQSTILSDALQSINGSAGHLGS